MLDLLRLEDRRDQGWRETVTGFLRHSVRIILGSRCFTYPHRWDSGQRRLAHAILLVPTAGPLTVVEDGVEERVTPGMAAIVRRGRAFRIRVPHETAVFCSVHLDAVDASQCSWFDLLPGHAIAGAFTGPVRATLLDAAHLTWSDEAAARVMTAHAAREAFMGWISTGGRCRERAAAADPLVADVVRLAERRLAAGISADDLRAASGLGETRFRQRFAAATGLVPARFLADLRLRLAADLLHTTDLPVRAIASRCGYSEDRYLHACFRARFKLTPLAYRAAGLSADPGP